MNAAQQRAEAKRFAERWKGRGYEKGECQSFWLSLIGDVLGVEHPDEFIRFEKRLNWITPVSSMHTLNQHM